MKPKYLILIIIILALVIIGIYGYLQFIEKKYETDNWQTYRNEEYGFEIKYPKEWISNGAKYSEKPNLFGAEVIGFVRFYPKDKRWINFIFDERVSVFPVGISLLEGSLQQYLSEFSEETIKEILINNIPATKIEGGITPVGGRIYQYVFDVSKNDRFITISNAIPELMARLKVLYETEFPEENEFQDIFNQMLSTFKFSE